MAIKIEKLVPGGQGIATLPSGIKAFFWNALPGETVLEYRVTKKKSHYIEAIAEKIENPSEYRIKPKDDCFLSTSPWQIMSYDFELEQKRLLLVETFRQNDIIIKPNDVQTDGKDFFYRNKMEYSLYWDKELEKILPAFHQRGSHYKIPVESSSIERPEIFKKALEIIDELNARGEEARKYQSLLLRCNQNGEISGGLYENHKPHPVFKNLKDEILGQAYSYSPNGFFQINLPVYEMALTEIKKHISTEKVLDLYAGVGTIGLSVARDKELKLVEVDKSAFAELDRNATGFASMASFEVMRRPLPSLKRPSPVKTGARDAGLETRHVANPLAILSRSEDVLDFIEPDQTVILDPPRAGCDTKLVKRLNEVKPKTIIYLSCNPSTQARDLKSLLENYEIKNVTPYNFFPRTPHLENLIILNLK